MFSSVYSSTSSGPKADESRATVEEVCQYFHDFVQKKGLADNFLNNHTVNGVKKVPCRVLPKPNREGLAGNSLDSGRSPEEGFDKEDADCKITRLHKKLLKDRDYVWEICGHDDKGALVLRDFLLQIFYFSSLKSFVTLFLLFTCVFINFQLMFHSNLFKLIKNH